MNNDELDKQLLGLFSDTKLNSSKLDDILAESARLNLTNTHQDEVVTPDGGHL